MTDALDKSNFESLHVYVVVGSGDDASRVVVDGVVVVFVFVSTAYGAGV